MIVCKKCNAAVAASDDLDGVAAAFPNGCPYCRRTTDNGVSDPRQSPRVKSVHDQQDEEIKKPGGSKNVFEKK